MPTDNLSDVQIKQIRRLCRDVREPYWFTDEDLDAFYVEELCDIDQAAALALESWATDMDIGLGGYSAQGITVNGQQMAANMRLAADRLRLRKVHPGYYGVNV